MRVPPRARSARPFIAGVALAVLAPASSALGQSASSLAAPSTASSPMPPASGDATSPAGDSVVSVAARGPTLDGARAGVTTPRSADAPAAAYAAPRSGSVGQPAALMLVGGAAVVVGLLVGNTGGDLLAFGGAVVGLVGLYQYLR